MAHEIQVVDVELKELLADVRGIILSARGKVKAAVNFAMVEAYWQIGKSIVEKQGGEERAKYGDDLIRGLSIGMTAEFGEGFGVSNIRYMRQFYLEFPIRHALRGELNWTHYRQLLGVKDEKARNWYMNECADEGWSSRQLSRQISVLYYERMLASRDKDDTRADARENLVKDAVEYPPAPKHFIRDPYVLEFLGLKDYPGIHENNLESSLMNNLSAFLLELGKGFSFVARQKHIQMEDRDFYIDLVFYNCILKCYVLIDLKMGELTYQDIGQMDGYVRLYEEKYRRADDNPTIGLLLCSKKNEAVAKYSVLNESKQLFASKYLLELPSEEELRQMIERERAIVEARCSEGGLAVNESSRP